MVDGEGYRLATAAATGEVREKGSRFLALLEPVTSAREARQVLVEESLRQLGIRATRESP